jgi:hypothetical protein
MDATQVLRPIDATAILPPVDATHIFSPIEATQAIAPVYATQVFQPLNATQVIRPIDAAQALPPIGATQVLPAVAGVRPPEIDPRFQPAPPTVTGTNELHTAVLPDDGYFRPAQPRRTGSIAAVGIAFLAAGIRAPYLSLLIFAAVVLICRVVGQLVDDFHLRRELAGQRRKHDAVVVAARSPLTVIKALFSSIPQLLVGLFAAIIIGALGSYVLGENSPIPPLSCAANGSGCELERTALLAATLATAFVVTWFGTYSRITRYGARTALNAVAPGKAAIAVVIVAILAAALLIYFGVAADPRPLTNWWPGSPPPIL